MTGLCQGGAVLAGAGFLCHLVKRVHGVGSVFEIVIGVLDAHTGL